MLSSLNTQGSVCVLTSACGRLIIISRSNIICFEYCLQTQSERKHGTTKKKKKDLAMNPVSQDHGPFAAEVGRSIWSPALCSPLRSLRLTLESSVYPKACVDEGMVACMGCRHWKLKSWPPFLAVSSESATRQSKNVGEKCRHDPVASLCGTWHSVVSDHPLKLEHWALE